MIEQIFVKPKETNILPGGPRYQINVSVYRQFDNLRVEKLMRKIGIDSSFLGVRRIIILNQIGFVVYLFVYFKEMAKWILL